MSLKKELDAETIEFFSDQIPRILIKNKSATPNDVALSLLQCDVSAYSQAVQGDMMRVSASFQVVGDDRFLDEIVAPGMALYTKASARPYTCRQYVQDTPSIGR